MKWWSRIETWLAPLAVPNVTLILVIGQIAYFVAAMASGRDADSLVKFLIEHVFTGERVWDGKWWLPLLFPFQPVSGNPIWAFFGWILLHLMGTALERQLGELRYNLFLLTGYLATVAVALWVAPFWPISNRYWLLVLMLSFARVFPDFMIRLHFVLPIKIKWLALVYWLLLGYSMYRGPADDRWVIAAAVLPYVLFFGRSHADDLRQRQRKRTFEAKVARSSKLVHRCAVCGLTSDEDPRETFRYCSQCSGGKCYCSRHLREHEHVPPAATQ